MKAYFQLFRIDPRVRSYNHSERECLFMNLTQGVIPNENEQIELTRMIKPLLDYAVLNNTSKLLYLN